MVARLFLSLCLLWLLLPLQATAQSCAPNKDYVPIAKRAPKALLYEIKRCNYPTSYIFGTFHSDSPDLGPLYHFATTYLQHTKVVVLELELDNFSRTQAQDTLKLPQNSKPLSELIGKEKFARIKKHILPKLTLTKKQAERYKPWALAMMAQYPPQEGDGLVIDEKLQRYGETWSLKIIGLESAQSQLSIFDKMPAALQMDFVDSTIADAPDLQNQHDELKAHYIAQDLPAIAAMSERVLAHTAADYPKLAAYIEDHVLLRRNRTMASKLNGLLKHSLFVAIGALHLPGDQGVLSLLEKRGYELEPVFQNQQEAPSAESSPQALQW